MYNIYRNMLLHAGIMRAPPELNGIASFGGGTQQSGGGQQTQQSQQEEEHNHVPLFGQEGEGGEESGFDFLEAFGQGQTADDFDDTTGGDAEFGEIPQEEVQGLQTEISNIIKNAGIPASAIPQDFDPNNRDQMLGLINTGVQAALQQALGIVFKPTQMALKHMASQIDTQIDSKIQGSRDTIQARSILEEVVPEINDPKHAGMIQTLDSSLKANGKKPRERANTIRKMLNQMGIRSNSGGNRRQSSNPNGGGSPSIKTGQAALDSFFGSFKAPGSK